MHFDFLETRMQRTEETPEQQLRFFTFVWNDAGNPLLLQPGCPVMVWRKDACDRNRDRGADCEAVIEETNIKDNKLDTIRVRYNIDGSEYTLKATKLIRRFAPNEAPLVIICRDSGSFRRQCWAQVRII